MRLDSIVFDLDGTLWDTTPACAVAWNSVLSRNAITYREITADDVRKVTGKPHDDCIRQTFDGIPHDQVQTLITETATEDNAMIARMGGAIYPGVREGLKQLAEHFPLFIVSNCQTGYIETFLGFSGFAEFFQDFECFGNTHMPKGENLRRVIERNNLRSPVMIGDADGDEVAARACNVPFILASYGFGSGIAPDFVCHSFPEITELLLAHRTPFAAH